MGLATLPAADPANRFYATVRIVGRFWLWFFFKGVEVRHRERVPPAGPVLLCINHPNNLIDSLLVGTVLERKVHYLATASLFRNPLVARFLRACGAIPVYRKQDDPDRTDRNEAAFAACFRALEEGRLIGIYPEGTTHAEQRVKRIKTGAARIALEHEARRRAEGDGRAGALALIPVGLSFEARKSFRGRVLVSFGVPIPVAPYLSRHADDPARAVHALTSAIQSAMEAQVIHVERIDHAELGRAVETLYGSDLIRELQEERGLSPRQIDTFRLSRSIADAVAYFQEREPARVEQLWLRIQQYQAMLAAYRIRDHAVRARLERPSLRRRLRHSGLASAGLPLFAYGALVNALPYFVPRWLAHRLARKETDYATTRLLASMVAFPLFWGLEVWIAWRLAGALWAALFALSLPLSGLAAYRYLGGMSRLRSQLRLGWVSLGRGQAASRLLAERRELVALLEQAKMDYLAATRGSTL
jgi:glycerol-3-phosphate O-acyltransferase/dihydroxyacetone phosphate acyltransferase